MRPFSQLSRAALARVPALLSDVDGTLTTGDELRASTIAALERVRNAGVPVVLVTGRPAGYAELMARYLPVRGVIAENGGLYFVRTDGAGSLRKRYAVPDQDVRAKQRSETECEVSAALHKFPGARLSMDSRYTEVDLAIDYNEEARLPVDTAREIERFLRARGVQAVRSSVHVNVWAGRFDKRSTSLLFLRQELGLRRDQALAQCIYLGDSYNDAPMFGAFAHSVGVAQVRTLGPELAHAPAYVTRAREGRGAEEVLRALARAR